MKCTVCGAQLCPTSTDLPFKISDHTIVIVRNLPVLQCGGCSEYVIEDNVLVQIEHLLSEVDSAAELEVIRYAA